MRFLFFVKVLSRIAKTRNRKVRPWPPSGDLLGLLAHHGASWGPWELPGASWSLLGPRKPQEAPGGPRKIREAPRGSVSWSHFGKSWSLGNILGPFWTQTGGPDDSWRNRFRLGGLWGHENTWLCGSGRMWSFQLAGPVSPHRAPKFYFRVYTYMFVCWAIRLYMVKLLFEPRVRAKNALGFERRPWMEEIKATPIIKLVIRHSMIQVCVAWCGTALNGGSPTL